MKITTFFAQGTYGAQNLRFLYQLTKEIFHLFSIQRKLYFLKCKNSFSVSFKFIDSLLKQVIIFEESKLGKQNWF